MPFFDMTLSALEAYQPDTPEPEDFATFWQQTLDAARATPLQPTFAHVDAGLRALITLDVTFQGYGGQSVKGWLIYPKAAASPLPCIVQYLGYGSGRGFPHNWLLWSAAGYAHFIMDTRGQGGGGLHGDTPDIIDADNPSTGSFMTRGIWDKQQYYYRRVYTDAVRAIETAAQHKMVDAARIAVAGGSQGGGLSIVAAGLAPELVSIALPDVPFLCDFRRALRLPIEQPYADLIQYLKVQRHRESVVFETLNYFDGIHFAKRIQADCLFSVGLMDMVCPPSTVYGAYNNVPSYKEMRVYTYNQHEGGQSHQMREQIVFVNERWSAFALP